VSSVDERGDAPTKTLASITLPVRAIFRVERVAQ
jgi:hypothetical protein